MVALTAVGATSTTYFAGRVKKDSSRLKDSVDELLDDAQKNKKNVRFKDIDESKIKDQTDLSEEYFDSLMDGGIISGGRSGESAPLNALENSYYKTEGGHVIIYNSEGNKLLDISAERVKVWKKNVNPAAPDKINWSSYKLKNSNGQVEKTEQWILNYFGIGGQ